MRVSARAIDRKGIVLAIVAYAVFAIGCGAKPIILAVNVMKPAEVDLGTVRKIAIADFQGPGGSAVSNKVVTKLLAGRRFDILERARLAHVIDELALSQSGIVDATTAAKVGKAAGVDALVFGQVETYQVEDERAVTPLRKSRIVGYDTQCDRKGRCYRVPVTEGFTVNAPTTLRRGHVGISFRVVGVESGQVLAAKTATRNWEGVNIVDPYPDSEETIGSVVASALVGRTDPRAKSINLPAKSTILEQLAEEVATDVVGLISPHKVQVKTVWLPAEGTEPALKYLNAGLAKEAQDHLEGMLQRSKSLPAPFYYDLGLVYEVNDRLDDAEAMYKKAATLDMNDMYLKAISSVRQAKEDQKKLAEQQRAKP
ncbi:MAG: hypothetical protein HY574_08800 [candidate division NC10 bacterium]|nr:hypothetical protein [candidate division NC10 bacterium]